MTIDELRRIQEESGGWLPPAELRQAAQRIKLPLYELQGVATFYPEFNVAPPKEHTIKVCMDLSCHLRGAHRLYREIKNAVEDDPRFNAAAVELTECSCLGQCDRAPAIVIDDHICVGPDRANLKQLVADTLEGMEPKLEFPPALDVNRRTDPYASPEEHYSVIRSLVEKRNYDDVLDQMKAAGLRGMGGAGFDTYRKWGEIRKAKARAVIGVSSTGGLVNPTDREVLKYIVCNADESEVGTFKDREILLTKPHLVIEAMAIAALVVDASQGWIYIRHEYEEQAERCRAEIERARKLGILGPNVAGSGHAFDLEVFVSPGGYILGEQSAMLEALEGKRGQPRNRRTDIGSEGSAALSGLFNGPTLINNVETFVYVPLILKIGGDAFAKLGVNDCKGLKWIGISGDVESPGVFEVPLGMTFRQLLNLAGGVRRGRKLKAFCPSGPTYGLHPPELLDTPADFGRFDDKIPHVGSGAIIFLDDTRCVVDAALNLTQFFRNESCGKCVPCRVGSSKMVDLTRDISEGRKPRTTEEIENGIYGAEAPAEAGASDETGLIERLIDRLAVTLNTTSLCGLGQVVHMPIASVLKGWPDEVERHLAGRCGAGVCNRTTERRP